MEGIGRPSVKQMETNDEVLEISWRGSRNDHSPHQLQAMPRADIGDRALSLAIAQSA
jgi:hypothetical protein